MKEVYIPIKNPQAQIGEEVPQTGWWIGRGVMVHALFGLVALPPKDISKIRDLKYNRPTSKSV